MTTTLFDPRLYRLPNLVMTLLKPGKALPSNTAMFRVPLDTSKPVIANYLEQIYGLEVIKVSTAIYLGKVKSSPFTGKMVKKKDWKKAYVVFKPKAGEPDWTFPSPEAADELMKQPPGVDPPKVK